MMSERCQASHAVLNESPAGGGRERGKRERERERERV